MDNCPPLKSVYSIVLDSYSSWTLVVLITYCLKGTDVHFNDRHRSINVMLGNVKVCFQGYVVSIRAQLLQVFHFLFCANHKRFPFFSNSSLLTGVHQTVEGWWGRTKGRGWSLAQPLNSSTLLPMWSTVVITVYLQSKVHNLFQFRIVRCVRIVNFALFNNHRTDLEY